MISRRRFLGAGAGGALALLGAGAACGRQPGDDGGAVAAARVSVNDVHSRLNPTEVLRVAEIDSADALQSAIEAAASEGATVSVAGGRHAMGGQQFGTDTVLLDTARMSRVIDLDAERGIVEAEAGINWPQLIDFLVEAQEGRPRQWGIVQKQTGADRLTLGGALSANAHGRGLTYRPIVQDVESFRLIDASGRSVVCSRDENPQLFALAIGGYGCFGAIATVRLRLGARRKIERVVELLDIDEVMDAFNQRIAAGYLYGDFQYAIDSSSDDFMSRGVFSCYRPVAEDTPMPAELEQLSEEAWGRLALLSHADKQRAFDEYTGYYLGTSGQVYWSDTHQLSYYLDDYHRMVSQALGATEDASEMITEIYVPRGRLVEFMSQARETLRARGGDVIYGTIRLIERDDESFLAWAREPWACIIFNLHVVHTPAGIEAATAQFLALIDHAIEHGGSYFPTYHRWARRSQVEACHPQLPEFLRHKLRHDPDERFQSDWYRHYREMFGDAL